MMRDRANRVRAIRGRGPEIKLGVTAWVVIVFVILFFGSAVWAAPPTFNKRQQHAATAYEDEANVFSASQTWQGSLNTLGPGSGGNVTLDFDQGAADEPSIRYNDTSNKFEFTNDGTTWIEFLESGSGFDGDVDTTTNKQLNNGGTQNSGTVGIIDGDGLVVVDDYDQATRNVTIDGPTIDTGAEHLAILAPLGVTGNSSITGTLQLSDNIEFDSSATSIGVVAGDLTFIDANTGTKTLAELAAGGSFSGDIESATDKQLSNSGAQNGGAVGVVDGAGFTVVDDHDPATKATTIDGFTIATAAEHIAILDPVGITGNASITAGTLAVNTPALKLNATSASSGYSNAFEISYTAAAGGSGDRAIFSTISGAPGSKEITAGRFYNTTTGTGTLGWTFSDFNTGAYGQAIGSTAGHNAGVLGSGRGSSAYNFGLLGSAGHYNSAAGVCLGAVGVADGTDGVAVGVAAFIANDDDFGTPATLTETAFLADNGNAASPIAVFRDNGVEKGRFLDGGVLQLDEGLVVRDNYDSTVRTTVIDGNTIATDAEHVAILDPLGVTGKVSVTAGTLAASVPGLEVSATTAGSGYSNAVSFAITAASGGSGARSIYSSLSGAAGSIQTAVAYFENLTTGTSAEYWTFGFNNLGVLGACSGTTAGHNVGVSGFARGSSGLNVGLAGASGQFSSATGPCIGVIGRSDGTDGVGIGVYASLANDDDGGAPTLTEAALLADNGNAASPVITARDNGTVVLEVEDGGILDVAPGGVRSIYSDTDNTSISAGSVAQEKSVTGRLYSVGNRSQAITGDSTASEDNFTETITLAANYLRAGRYLRYRFWGTYDADIATTATFRMNLGGTDIVSSDAPTLLNSAGNSWMITGTIYVEASGASGVIQGEMETHTEGSTDTISIETGSATVDTTASKAMTPSIQFSGSSASNGAIILGGYIEALN